MTIDPVTATYYAIVCGCLAWASPRLSPLDRAPRRRASIVGRRRGAGASRSAPRHRPLTAAQREEPRSRPAAQHRRRLRAERRRVGDRARDLVRERLRAVGPQDLAAEAAAARRRARRARRSASGTSRRAPRETPAPPRAASPVGASWIGASSAATRSSPRRCSTPIAPWATAGSISSGSIGARGTASSPSRLQPRHGEEASPPPRPPRACAAASATLPRNSTTARSGRRCSTCARRRRLEVPTTLPARQRRRARPRPARRRRRAGPRAAGSAVMASPSGCSVGMSFIECTAMSIAPADQRLLDLAGEEALAAERRAASGPAPGRRWCGSPRSRRPPPAGRAPPSAGRAPRAPAPAPAGCRGCRCGAGASGSGRSRGIGGLSFPGPICKVAPRSPQGGEEAVTGDTRPMMRALARRGAAGAAGLDDAPGRALPARVPRRPGARRRASSTSATRPSSPPR